MKSIQMFALFLLFALRANALTAEITHMHQILPAIVPGTLVIFDIDNTILQPVQTLGSDQWFSCEVKKLVAGGSTEPDAVDRVIPLWMQIQTRSAVMAVESNTPQIIRELQARRYPVMTLTARDARLAVVTTSQLKSVGVGLVPIANGPIRVGGDPSTLVTGGIVFAGPKNVKGEVLKSFLMERNLHPKRIVFVDDKPHHVESVGKALAGTGIAYYGFRYGAADAQVKAYNPQIAAIQLKAFLATGKLISDQQAGGSQTQRRVVGF